MPAMRRRVDQPHLAVRAPQHVAAPQVAVQPCGRFRRAGDLADSRAHTARRSPWPACRAYGSMRCDANHDGQSAAGSFDHRGHADRGLARAAGWWQSRTRRRRRGAGRPADARRSRPPEDSASPAGISSITSAPSAARARTEPAGRRRRAATRRPAASAAVACGDWNFGLRARSRTHAINPGIAASDHDQHLVEPGIVAVVRIRHVRAVGVRIERTEQPDAIGIGHPAQRAGVPGVERHQQIRVQVRSPTCAATWSVGISVVRQRLQRAWVGGVADVPPTGSGAGHPDCTRERTILPGTAIRGTRALPRGTGRCCRCRRTRRACRAA